MSQVATQLDELRDAVGEIGALVARAVEALWRIFQSEKLVRGWWMDGAVMEVLIYGNELPIPEEFAPMGLADDGSNE